MIMGSSSSVIRTTLFPHGTKPFRYAQNNDNEETQLIALGKNHKLTISMKAAVQKIRSGSRKNPRRMMGKL